MYLRQIELENFKSFGGKVVVPLMEGYMAITGPNGSGKSNIGDAIMFVLGPKSPKAVRAGRITDLIFSGGASKARAKFMKVSLVFENSDRVLPWDDDTVTLTRYVKLSDNGQDYTSYFYINDQKSTLGEFDSLLTKARISADGYNIVQQGDVTHIVQMGNIERRRILDGISGISSFDADISKAKEEKDASKMNLEITEPLREDKEKQLRKLEKERAEAEKYLEAKSVQDLAKAQLVVRQKEREAATLESLNQYVVKLEGQLQGLKEDKEKAKNDHAVNEQAIAEKDREIEAKVGPEYVKIKNDVEDVKIKLATEKDRKETAEQDIESQNSFKAGFQESLEDNRNNYKTLNQNLNDLQIQYDSANAEYEAAKAEEAKISEETSKHGGELTELQKKLEILNKQIDEASIKDQDAKTTLAAAKAVKEHAQVAKAEAEEALSAAQFEVKDSDWNFQELQKSLGPIQSGDLSKKILAMKQEEAQLEAQESTLRGILEKRTADYNRMAAEKRATDAVNGAGEAVNRILQLKATGEIPGIRGTIAELAKVAEGYETALSVAAGGKMQSVVVDTDATAARCIQYLKSNGLGRASFLPLNKMMPGKPRAKAIMVLKKTEGYATDFLDFAPEYTNAFWYVFQDTLVVRSLDAAREIMGGIRIVTREGELVEASGAMVGGTINKRSMAKFGTATPSALNEAAEGVKSANEAVECVRAKLKELRENIRLTDNEMRAASTKDIDAQGKLAAAKAALDQAKKSLSTAEESLAKKAKDLEAAEKESLRKASEAEATSQTLEVLRSDRAATRDRIAVIAPAGLQERIQAIRNKVFDCSQNIAELGGQIGGVKAEMSGLDKQKEALDLQVAESERKITVQVEAIKQHDDNIIQLGVSLEALKKIEAEMEAGLVGLKDQKDALVQKRYELDAAIQKIQTSIETKEGVIASQKSQILESQANLSQLEAEVAALAVKPVDPIPSEEAIKRTLRECEERIAAIGNVNLNAIEDFGVMKKEYDDLVDQIKTINSRIAELDKLTDDLTAKKSGLFMKTYNAVNENFRAIYAQLSGGGEGYMVLDCPEDPFSGGLQINAKPRNGKLLRLEALSGGEKSLTALSFIFAIQEYQPSPFYVLDEVDMFLDAVNSEMVAKRVKESSAKAQFIQVSLRKVTLTMADHLIGVTRPPSGISRVIEQPDLDEVSKYEEEAMKKQKQSEENEG